MASKSEELETNAFYKILQTKYADKFTKAQLKNWIICIPCQKSLKGVVLTQRLLDCHILKPSPYLKGHYITTDPHESRTFEIENENIYIYDRKGKIKILREETGYNENYKPFRLLLIDKPLTVNTSNKRETANCGNTNSLGVSNTFENSNYLTILQSYSQPWCILNKKINQFCSSYMVLPDYLQQASMKLQSIVEWAHEAFSWSGKQNSMEAFDCDIEKEVFLEHYILTKVHHKIYPVIKKALVQEDKYVTERLLSLYKADLKPEQLGIEEHFCCGTPSAVAELSSLNSKTTPTEKLLCLVGTLESMNQDIEKSVKEKYCAINLGKDIPCLSSDDLIPLLVNLLIQVRPSYLASNLYYIQNFSWHLSTKDKASFSLVTFQAAKEYLMSNFFNMLKPSTSAVGREMTIEDFINMAVEVQDVSVNTKSKAKKHSKVDSKLESITKMMESSTLDHSSCFCESGATCLHTHTNHKKYF